MLRKDLKASSLLGRRPQDTAVEGKVRQGREERGTTLGNWGSIPQQNMQGIVPPEGDGGKARSRVPLRAEGGSHEQHYLPGTCWEALAKSCPQENPGGLSGPDMAGRTPMHLFPGHWGVHVPLPHIMDRMQLSWTGVSGWANGSRYWHGSGLPPLVHSHSG